MRFKQKVILFFSIFLGWIVNLSAQSSFDIRLAFFQHDTLNKIVYYDVELRNAGSNSWGLAGQNYRLFYNATHTQFTSGESLLPQTYQPFNLVQHVENIDATSVSNVIPFANTLGFLNFNIDLNNLSVGGIHLLENRNWVSVARLSFKLIDNENNANSIETIWGRDGKTAVYAASFVEISEWIGANQTQAAIGVNYFDVSARLNTVTAKVLLQGPYDERTGLMRDDLRRKKYIPLQQPYTKKENAQNVNQLIAVNSGDEIISDTVLEDKGKNSIIDWVFLELRNKEEHDIVEATRSALLQRDGDIVDLDGISPVNFFYMPDSFFLAIRHRNHLGVLCSRTLSSSSALIDFSTPSTEVTGNFARLVINDKCLLWGGNADGDNFLAYNGESITKPDKDYVFLEIFTDSSNTKQLYNHISKGYYTSDTNMDGEVRYQGIDNDVNTMIFFNVISYPDNLNKNSNYVIESGLLK